MTPCRHSPDTPSGHTLRMCTSRASVSGELGFGDDFRLDESHEPLKGLEDMLADVPGNYQPHDVVADREFPLVDPAAHGEDARPRAGLGEHLREPRGVVAESHPRHRLSCTRGPAHDALVRQDHADRGRSRLRLHVTESSRRLQERSGSPVLVCRGGSSLVRRPRRATRTSCAPPAADTPWHTVHRRSIPTAAGLAPHLWRPPSSPLPRRSPARAPSPRAP